MSRVVAIGENQLIDGYALAGVNVIAADSPAAVLGAWESLGDDTGLLLLTPAARDAIGERVSDHPFLVWVTLPA
jgi:vacuolar-type H+-ATPase subunit F/Vma7